MATRDLTPLFIEARKRKTAFGILEGNKSDPKNRLLEDEEGGSDGQGSWRVNLPPKWVDTVDQIEASFRELDSKIESLNQLQNKRLMVTFDDSEHAQERKIEELSRAVTLLLKKSERQLKQVVAGGGAESDERVRRNIQVALAKKLQEKSSRFRSLQKEYMSKLKSQRTGSSGGSELEFLSRPGQQRGVSTQQISVGFTQQQLEVVDDLEQVAAERDEEITRIAESIEELSQIFKELAVLVIDQGTILDRIDFNMEQVVEHTKEGLGQLNKAEDHQKSARPIKCIVLLLFLIAVMLTALIMKNKKAEEEAQADRDHQHLRG